MDAQQSAVASPKAGSDAGAPEAAAQALAATVRILTKALRQLGDAGSPDAANRLGGQAWAAVRHVDPASAERINGTMHYLARLPDPVNSAHNHRL